MVNSKYYTPTIDEFYVGFEYEIRFNDVDNIWDKEVFTHDSHDPDYNPYFYIMKWIDNSVRVKYLDKTDIESLGFIDCTPKNNKKSDYYENRILFKKVWPDIEYPLDSFDFYYLDYNYNTGFITIDNGGSYDDRDVYFQGTVKNKSELIKLLKMLGIND